MARRCGRASASGSCATPCSAPSVTCEAGAARAAISCSVPGMKLGLGVGLVGAVFAAGGLVGCGGPAKGANDGDDVALLAEAPAANAASPPAPASTASGAAKADIARGTKALEGSDYAAAKKAFEAARAADPNDGEAAYYLGVTQEKAGARAAAESNYRDAIR